MLQKWSWLQQTCSNFYNALSLSRHHVGRAEGDGYASSSLVWSTKNFKTAPSSTRLQHRPNGNIAWPWSHYRICDIHGIPHHFHTRWNRLSLWRVGRPMWWNSTLCQPAAVEDFACLQTQTGVLQICQLLQTSSIEWMLCQTRGSSFVSRAALPTCGAKERFMCQSRPHQSVSNSSL